MPFIEKRSQTPETRMKDGFEEVELELLFGIPCIPTGKQDYLFRPSSTPGNFPLGRPRNGKMVKYQKDGGKRRVGSVCLGGMGF